MMHSDTIGGAVGTLARLERATNAHDVNEVVACFAADYRNETPAHPERGFTGREQVRGNWEQIFAAIPNITAKVLRSAVNGDEVWSEWEHRGTRHDGSAHLMRGVIIFGLGNELLTWARFYLEPVQEGGGNVDAAVRRQVGVPGPPPPAPLTEKR
jgi:ketosteroid isomerase-like protein